jgi:hypothetical protein
LTRSTRPSRVAQASLARGRSIALTSSGASPGERSPKRAGNSMRFWASFIPKWQRQGGFRIFLQSAHFPVFTGENRQLLYFRWLFTARALVFQAPVTVAVGDCRMYRAANKRSQLVSPDGDLPVSGSGEPRGASRRGALSTASCRTMRPSSFLAASRRHRSSIDRTASGEVLPNRLK